ncbi:MAG: hypothetical protein GX042_09275 [Bacteroidales bacterium]|jgi:hypothetical protein|nr:hypothetical protein [Bacteroidales bacterium]
MKDLSVLVPFFLIIALFTTEVQAQDFNDELKKNLRRSLITPEKRPSERQPHQSQQILPESDRGVLKVSPTTRLPTRGDRIQILYPPEKYLIHINLQTTNSTPINQRPTGSVRYWLNGNKLQIESTAGQLVFPSGMDMDPIRARNRRRHERTVKLMKAYSGE